MMMIEQEIEHRLADILSAELSADESTQIIGVWSTGTEKGVETNAANFVTLKVYPRSYDTPTIPTCIVRCDLRVISRVEADSTGADYLALTEKIMALVQSWQSDMDKVQEDFSVSGFSPAGFRIAQGDCGADKQSGTWQFSTQIEVHGVVALD